MTPPPVPYSQHAERHARARDADARLSLKISRARLAVFLIAVAFVIWTFAGEATPIRFVIAAVLFAIFGGLVAWHARVEERIAWLDAQRLVNLRGVARLRHDWTGLPPGDAPPGFDLSDHPYALDLDVFGRASLFQWLGPAATPRGSARLASWLLFPKPVREIVDRQEAVAELAGADGWRLDLSAHGLLAAEAREPEINRFLEWAEGEPPFGSRARLLQIVVYALMASIWVLIAAHATGIVPAALWAIPLLVSMVLSFATAKTITTTLDRAGGGHYALGRYSAIFAHAAAAPAVSKRLTALQARLTTDGLTAYASMRRLHRILGFGEVRRSAAWMHLPLQALTLWDFHVIFALERWRQTAGVRVRDWLEALGELDALALLAAIQRDYPRWAVPEIASIPEVEAEALGHPLIADDRRVLNDVTVGPPGTVLLVTGSNMSGKSTLLRALGLNIVLAQAGGPVCARRMSLPESDLQASIRVQDSLERGLSYFMAALARLKGVVDAAEHERPGRVLVFLLDEILQGTNSAERSIAVCAVTRHLLEARAIGAMTTHDLSLAEAEPFKNAATLVHFSETIEPGGAMHFDYKLRPGLATSRNALRLMQMIGIDV